MALCWFKAKHLKTLHSSPSELPFSAFLLPNKGFFSSSKHSKHIFLVLFKAPIHLCWGKICMRLCDLYDYHHNIALCRARDVRQRANEMGTFLKLFESWSWRCVPSHCSRVPARLAWYSSHRWA